jgi:hypothetical protein
MAQPGVSGVHTDAVLTNISVAFMQDQSKYIAQQVFPVVTVDKASNFFYKYDQEDWFRDEAEKRADATESKGSGYEVGKDSYSCDVFAFHKDVGDQLLANADAPLNPLREATQFVASRMLLRQERQFVADFLQTGVWSNEFTGVASGPTGNQFVKWSDYANSDPIQDVERFKESIAGKTGYDPNVLTLGKNVFTKLKNHPDIIDRIKYTSSENVTKDLLARLFEVDKVLVSTSMYATNKEGQTGAYGYNFGDGILLTHSASSPGLLTPSAGYTFAWTGVSDGAGLAIGTTQFRMDHLRAERIESQSAWDNKVIAADLGALASAVV